MPACTCSYRLSCFSLVELNLKTKVLVSIVLYYCYFHNTQPSAEGRDPRPADPRWRLKSPSRAFPSWGGLASLRGSRDPKIKNCYGKATMFHMDTELALNVAGPAIFFGFGFYGIKFTSRIQNYRKSLASAIVFVRC